MRNICVSGTVLIPDDYLLGQVQKCLGIDVLKSEEGVFDI